MELLRDTLKKSLYGKENCLNPCCNGITERQLNNKNNERKILVLILVVMELLRDLYGYFRSYPG